MGYIMKIIEYYICSNRIQSFLVRIIEKTNETACVYMIVDESVPIQNDPTFISY